MYCLRKIQWCIGKEGGQLCATNSSWPESEHSSLLGEHFRPGPSEHACSKLRPVPRQCVAVQMTTATRTCWARWLTTWLCSQKRRQHMSLRPLPPGVERHKTSPQKSQPFLWAIRQWSLVSSEAGMLERLLEWTQCWIRSMFQDHLPHICPWAFHCIDASEGGCVPGVCWNVLRYCHPSVLQGGFQGWWSSGDQSAGSCEWNLGLGLSTLDVLGGFSFNLLVFSPLIGEMLQFDYIFEIGWGHQLVSRGRDFLLQEHFFLKTWNKLCFACFEQFFGWWK